MNRAVHDCLDLKNKQTNPKTIRTFPSVSSAFMNESLATRDCTTRECSARLLFGHTCAGGIIIAPNAMMIEVTFWNLVTLFHPELTVH